MASAVRWRNCFDGMKNACQCGDTVHVEQAVLASGRRSQIAWGLEWWKMVLIRGDGSNQRLPRIAQCFIRRFHCCAAPSGLLAVNSREPKSLQSASHAESKCIP